MQLTIAVVGAGLAWVAVCVAQEAAAPLPPEATKAETLLEQVIEAMGGENFLQATDLQARGRLYTFNRGQLASPGERFTYYLKLPAKERIELGKDGKIAYVNNENEGWELDREGVREQTPEQIESFLESSRRDLHNVLRFRARGEKVQVYYLGREFIDNRRAEMLELVDERGDSLKLVVDARTFLPMQLRYRERDALTGEWMEVAEYYGKYVNIQGLQTPLHIMRERAGLRSLEVYFRELQYNTGVPDQLFTRASLEEHWRKVK